jgi:hypothetical protein
MARKTFLCLALIIGVFLSASPVFPCEKILFGPKEFKVGRFHFHSSFQSFKAGKSGDAILEISSANSHGKIRSGFVSLNGRFFSLHSILHAKKSTMEVPVHLRDRNYLWVFLYGKSGAAIRLKVREAAQGQTNHEPTAKHQSVELDEDTPAAITLTGTDQDGDPLTFKIVSTPAHGTLSGNAPALNYTPSADYNGSDTFTFIVNDGQADSQAATVNLAVKPVNDAPIAAATVHIAVIPANNAPVAAPISLAIAKVGEPVSLDGSQSTDVDGDQLTYLWTWTSYPAGIEPALGNATTPSASFVPYLPGEYKLRLVVNDGKVDSSPDDVTISVAYVPFSLTEEKLKASDGTVGDLFGSSVSVDNYRAVIGAEGKETAYVFESNSPWSQTAQLRAADGTVGDRFGSAVAVSGDYALVGAQGVDDRGENSGSAYLFRWDGTQWIQAAKLIADNGEPGDFFGAAVSISGDHAVVGAYGDDTSGDEWVQIFGMDKYVPGTNVSWDSNINGWVNAVNNRIFLYPADWARNFRPKAIKIKHTAPSTINLLRVLGVNNQILGSASSYTSGTEISLANTADIGLVSALSPPAVTNIEFLVQSAGGGLDAGSAYVFKRTGEAWTQQTHLKASDGTAGDAFGISVAVSAQTVIVGADMDDDKGLDSGSAYVFAEAESGWTQEAKLLATDGQEGDHFGASVAISGIIAVVGAPGADTAWTDSGAAYLFRYNGGNWVEEAKLAAVDGKAGDQFGASVSISADYVVVGASGADGSGALYVYKFDGSVWSLEGKVAATDAAPGQNFGGSVSMSGDTILSGAAGDSAQTGAAYAYSIDTYHTASISANPETIRAGGSTDLSWSWINALIVQVEPGIGTFVVEDDPIGSGLFAVSPDTTTTYTIEAFGPYGKDTSSVTVFVESEP